MNSTLHSATSLPLSTPLLCPEQIFQSHWQSRVTGVCVINSLLGVRNLDWACVRGKDAP